MTHEDQVLALLAGANPVRDAEAFASEASGSGSLVVLEQRREPMQETKPSVVDRPESGIRKGWIAAIAAVVVLIIGAAALVLSNRSESPPVITEVTTTIDTQAQAAIEAVTSAFGALSDGDVDAWIDALTGEEQEGATIWRNQFEADLVANRTFSLPEGCTYQGVDGDGLHVVACRVVVNDDFLTALGIVDGGDGLFYLDEDLKIVTWNDNATSNDPGDYETEFLNWFYQEHPEVAGRMTALRGAWYDRTPADMAIVLEYLDEFIAQSDLYPIEP